MNKAEVIKIVKDTLDYQLIDGWAYFLLFALTGLGSYFGSFIKAKAQNDATNANFTNILDQQKKLSGEIGSIKSELEKSNIEYQIKLSNFNLRSLESIELIFSKLIKLKNLARDLNHQDVGENENMRLLAQEFFNTTIDFFETFDVKKIWLPKEISKEIASIANELSSTTSQFFVATRTANRAIRLTDGQLDKIIEKQDRFYDFIDNKLNPLVGCLTDKIIETNGV